ncbi:MAG: DUF11 domain-containing protein [Anaerolineae bacterium]|nr:DUF11 domain-containing protein [Anaerolineae bacterium]
MRKNTFSAFGTLFDVIIGTLIVGVAMIHTSEDASAVPESLSYFNNDSFLLQTSPISVSSTEVCNNFYFHNQNKDVGDDGSQKIANTTTPTGSTPATVSRTLSFLLTTYEEVARFYSDPAATSDVNVVDDIVGSIWLQTTDYSNTDFLIELFDYNPSNGQTTSLGDVEFGFINSGQNEVVLNITPPNDTVIPVGHRLLAVLSAQSPLLFSPTVTLYYDGTSRDSFFTLCQLTPPALEVTKTGPSAVVSGEQITYQLTITNSGGLAATNLTLSDVLPVGANYVSGGTKVGNMVTWSVPTLAPQASVQKNFIVTASDTITNNTYQVTADGGISVIGEQSVVTLVSQPGQPNLSITKSGPNIVEADEQISYTITVFNGGDTSATNLVINDTIPTGATYISGGTLVGNKVRWNRGTLAADATAQFTFVVTASNDIKNDTYSVSADGGIMSVGQNTVNTKVTASSKILEKVYMPFIIKSEASTKLVIESVNTGGINSIKILHPNDNTELLRCTVGNNVTKTCGSFSSIGSYKIIADTANCGVLQGTFNDAKPGATVTRRIFCN